MLCSAAQRKGVGQFLVGRVTVGNRCDGGTASSPFWEGEVVYVVDWKGCSCFSLCAGAFLALSWSCVLRGSFVFPSVKGSLPCTDIRMWYSGLAGRACWMLATARGVPESRTIKSDYRFGCYCDTWGPMCLHAALRQNSMEESNMSRLSVRAYTREARILRISKQRVWSRPGVKLSFSPNAPMRESLALLSLTLFPSTYKIHTVHPHEDIHACAAITL